MRASRLVCPSGVGCAPHTSSNGAPKPNAAKAGGQGLCADADWGDGTDSAVGMHIVISEEASPLAEQAPS
jgi:hypothetical protein